MASNSTSQIGAATALVQLLQEHPELQTAAWTIRRESVLSGTIAYQAQEDMRPAMHEYAAVLGGDVHDAVVQLEGEGPQLTLELDTTWRDVPVRVWASCAVAAVASEQVAA